MHPLVFEHFSSNNRNSFFEDCCITLIDKTDGSDPTRREEYWRRVLVEHDRLIALSGQIASSNTYP